MRLFYFRSQVMRALFVLGSLSLIPSGFAQRIELPANLPSAHPRVSTRPDGSHPKLLAKLAADANAREEVALAEAEVARYIAFTDRDPMWLASRLQMYWKSHATEIYNRGDVFDHVAGHAPVATVRYPGSRNPTSPYRAPSLEDIPPFEDDTRGVWLVNSAALGQPAEWADPAKSGRVIDGINSHIMHLASTAARLYWITGDEKYARFATPVLDTYLRGMYYRKEPIDMTHGHSQTIYGMSTFEVIQEGILQDVAAAYDFLHPYLEAHDETAIPIYTDAMRQWIDVTVHNGVPFNNWDLIEARFITAIALVLENDSFYADHRGEQYYLNVVLNDSVTRQWSLSKLAARGFDADTAIWFESPGYSTGVVGDFISIINDLDSALGTDLLPRFPVVERAVLATGEYLYPNGYTVCFGDGHHMLLTTYAARQMVKDARRHGRRDQEVRFTAMVKLLEANATAAGRAEAAQRRRGLETVFAVDDDELDPAVPAMTMAELVAPTFSAPSVSYFVQRNGIDSQNGLMAAEAGSLGNHQHANGITLEMYGRGMVMAPESGIGTNYFESDHAEYYSQFTASNTVAVDGISAYPTMKSHHGFEVVSSYPRPPIGGASDRVNSDATVTYSDVYFHEPESDADQRRLVSIVRTSPANGYYVDIFRSKRRDGKDKMHDYFFHGLGQSMELSDANGTKLPLRATDELTFANEELPGYDYFWDKRSTRFAGDFRAGFLLALPGKSVQMLLWMAGSPDREIFAVKAPATRAADFLPKEIGQLPMPTLVARQFGEAWTHPYVAIFEPVDDTHPSAIASIHSFTPKEAPRDFVGVEVRNADGSRQRIFSTAKLSKLQYEGIGFQGTYGVAGEASADRYLFLGDGLSISRDGVKVQLDGEDGAAELNYGSGEWRLNTTQSGKLVVATQKLAGKPSLQVQVAGIAATWVVGVPTSLDGAAAMEYALPALSNARLSWHDRAFGPQPLQACATSVCPYMDAALPAEDRAKDLVARMTLDEKVSQTLDQAPAIPRLGVPEYNWWNEALHGVARNGFATTFPQAIGLAATWDTALMLKIGDTISTEGRAKYNEALLHNDHSRYAGLTFWSPNVNIFRDPRWGRGQETYGEDPFLTGQMAVSFVRGLQGNDPHYLKAIATPKHFAVHSGPEPARHGFNVDASPYDLEDTYLPAFRAAIVDGKADSIMCAYNAVEKSPACASDLLLQNHLRDDWKFRGYVVSDCDAIADVARGHHFAVDDAHASAVSLRAGTDLDCGNAYKQLGEAVRQKLVEEREIDTAAVRLFTARFRLGMFDPAAQVPFSSIAMTEVDSPAHRRVALQAARESIVLLQNREGILPLKAQKRITVVGPTAELVQSIEGNYTATAPHPVLPLEGIEKQFHGARVTYAPGSILADGLRTPVPSSVFRMEGPSHDAGLRAEYFDNLDFAGTPKLVRADRKINFNWSRVGPAAGFDSRRFSVRWTGALVPPGAGTYTFAFRGAPAPPKAKAREVVDPTGENVGVAPVSSSLKIYLDGKIILDNTTGMLASTQTFADTQPHSLRIEYVRTSDDRYFSFEWLPPARPLLDQAVAAARSSDLVVAFVGLSPDLEGEEMNVHVDGFNGGDRTDIGLPAVQESLLEAVKATGKPLVVVLTSGSAVAANWADKNADALLEAWYDGEEAGTAIAETLAGENNPSGRLPITFYNDIKELPPFSDYTMHNRTYRYFNGSVLYPFGYGLSYSNFSYKKVSLSSGIVSAGAPVIAMVDVRNNSKLAGEEVVEVYVQAPGSLERSHPFLAAFTRVHLAAGEARLVSIPIDPRQLSRVDSAGVRRILEGEYTISAGGGQPHAGRSVDATLRIEGNVELPR